MNTENKVTMEKSYRYRSGEPARILCVDAPGKAPVVSVAENGSLFTHSIDGKWSFAGRDLIEIREPRVIWVNEYELGLYYNRAYMSEDEADKLQSPNRIACRKFIEVIEGE